MHSCFSHELYFRTSSRDGLNTRLKDKKDMYTDLEMSGALARELRRVPEEDLTIKVRNLTPSQYPLTMNMRSFQAHFLRVPNMAWKYILATEAARKFRVTATVL